jgi:hypothetical protein
MLVNEQVKILENIPCHVMEYSWYNHFPRGKLCMTWQNIPCHVSKYYTMSHAYSFGINNGLLISNMGLADRAFHCNLM